MQEKPEKRIKPITIVILSIIGFILVYYVIDLMYAHYYTVISKNSNLYFSTNDLLVEDLTLWQKDALLKVEDPNFYGHCGFDLKTPGAGITTISQACVKFIYFKKFTQGLKKIRQTLIAAVVFDNVFTKDEILRIFLNHAYLGSIDGKSIRGFKNAAIAFYGKPFSQLTEKEYLSLVAVLIKPCYYNILTNKANNDERVSRIEALIDGRYQPKGLNDLLYDKNL